MMGLYPSKKDEEKLPDHIGSPPFVVRDEAKLIEKLQGNAVPHGFVPIAVMSYESHSVDDFRTESCPKYEKAFASKEKSPDTFAPYANLVNLLKRPTQAALDLSEEMTAQAEFLDMYYYADVVTCKHFQGHHMNLAFTEEEWWLMQKVQAIKIGLNLGELDVIYLSKVVQRPL